MPRLFLFAWYTASQGTASGNASQSLAITKVAYSVGGTYDDMISLAEADNTKTTLLLSHWAANDPAVTTYYLDASGNPHIYSGTLKTEETLVKVYNVGLKAASGTADEKEAQKLALQGVSFTIKAYSGTKDGQNKFPWETGWDDEKATSAVLQLVAANGTADGKVANSTAASGDGIVYTIPSDWDGAAIDTIAKIAVRVDGGSITDPEQQESAATIDASFTVYAGE